MVNVFAVPVFFICFRECLETTIIVSVLLSFIKQMLASDKDPLIYKKLRKQIWLGILAGVLVCVIIGGAFIGVFYTVGADYFAKTENLWEGIFSLIAAVIITIMGAALLRVSKLQDKWKVKLAKVLKTKDQKTTRSGGIKQWSEKYAMFILPFVTVLREGLEAVIFIGGVSLGMPATAFPLAVLCGLGAGALVGFIIYKGGNFAPLQIFLIISTCFLYLVSAGLLSKGVWDLEANEWNNLTGGDAAETGSGPGSYDIRQSVWHVNCCNPKLSGGGGWGVFNSLFGWQNSATYGSVISYNLYWLLVIVGFLLMHYQESKGHLPLMKPKNRTADSESDDCEQGVMASKEKGEVNPSAVLDTISDSSEGSPQRTAAK